MSNIVLSKHQRAIQFMPPQFAELMTARFEGKKISEMSEREAMIFLKEKIILCIRSIGHYSEANDNGVVAFLCQGLRIEIIKNRKNLTDRELEIILQNLAKGQYKRKKEEFIACNLLSINLAIDSFYEAPERKMALNDYNTRLNEPEAKKTLSEAEIREIMIKGSLSAFESFKKDGSLPGSVSGIYDFLKKEFNIQWTKVEGAKIREQAKENYKFYAVQNGILLKDIPKNYDDAILIECKKICLKRYFKSITELKFNNPL